MIRRLYYYLSKPFINGKRQQIFDGNFLKDFFTLRKQEKETFSRFKLREDDFYPCLSDKTEFTNFDTHYVYHPAWASRIIEQLKPELHVDISSTLHFCTIISAFQKVKFYDYRPANIVLSNLETGSADITKLNFESNTIKSLSCMHTIEHIGLGRYGDEIDYNGDLKAINELKRVLAPSGNLLLVVPIGKPVIMFNAHRIYSYRQIKDYFSDLTLKEFSLIPDNALETGIIKDASEELCNNQNYGCGCFWFKKEE
jgi:hypothetical protein